MHNANYFIITFKTSSKLDRIRSYFALLLIVEFLKFLEVKILRGKTFKSKVLQKKKYYLLFSNHIYKIF